MNTQNTTNTSSEEKHDTYSNALKNQNNLNSTSFEMSDEELITRSEKNEELVKIVDIEETPFKAVKADGKWFLSMGKYRLTEPLETEQECREAATDASWWRILTLMQVMIRESDEILTLQKELETLKTKFELIKQRTETNHI